MSNSSLATYVAISPFRNDDRIDDNGIKHSIKKLTWHHMAGVLSVETFGNIVTRAGAEMSATYAIGSDARVGRYLDEKDRPWTSCSPSNDYQAVTIEISNSSMGEPWPISDAVLEKAIDLSVDICQRNGIKNLVYTGDSTGNFTFHYMFADTACPGTYIKSKANEIVKRINDKLNSSAKVSSPTIVKVTSSSNPKAYKKDDLVSISADATYYTGDSIPGWVKSQKWHISEISGDRVVLGKNESGDRDIQSPISTKFLIGQTAPAASPSFKPYVVGLAASTPIYTDASGAKVSGRINPDGVYTIIAEQVTRGIKYGKLKSGAGWVNLSTKFDPTIHVGDNVRVTSAIQYNGNPFEVYVSSYKVLQLDGNRAVISSDGKNVTAAVNTANLQKL